MSYFQISFFKNKLNLNMTREKQKTQKPNICIWLEQEAEVQRAKSRAV